MYYLTIKAQRKDAKRHICGKSNSIDELKFYYGVLNPKYVVEIMREKELGRPFSVWQSNPKYNTNHYDNRVRNHYINKLEEMI